MIATRTTTHAPAFSLSRALLRLLNCSTEQSRKIARNFFIKDGIELLLSRNNRFGANRLFAPVTNLAKFVPGPVFGFFWLKANVPSIKRFIRNSAAYWFVFVYLAAFENVIFEIWIAVIRRIESSWYTFKTILMSKIASKCTSVHWKPYIYFSISSHWIIFCIRSCTLDSSFPLLLDNNLYQTNYH